MELLKIQNEYHRWMLLKIIAIKGETRAMEYAKDGGYPNTLPDFMLRITTSIAFVMQTGAVMRKLRELKCGDSIPMELVRG